jgi:AbrB family looped-hinge helix DNA binding protein
MEQDRVTFTSKGQVVIPAKMRRKHGIRKGTVAVVSDDGARIVLEPVTAESIRNLRGSLKGKRCAYDLLLRERRKGTSL